MELKPIIENTILKNLRHKHYDKVGKLNEMYEAFIMNSPYIKDGETKYPLNDYLRQFVRREDDDLFEQRKNLTKHYVPSICAQIIKPFRKVVRSNRVIKLVDHEPKDAIEVIETTLQKFYGESSNNGVEQFLSERFLPLTFTDPNAWVWVTFDKFDGKKEKPQTFPVEYSSKAVINYEIKNDHTKWVIVKLSYQYLSTADEMKSADRFIIFGENESFEYKLIPKDIDPKETFLKGNEEVWIQPKNKDRYAVYSYTGNNGHKSGRVPLMRVGYVRDLATKSETFVNPFHYEALPLMMQFVKISSELQLSITLHAFPKQVTYTEKCEAKGCIEGLVLDGTPCRVCEGTGKNVHKSSADIIEIPMPKEKNMGDVMDASKFSAYIDFPGGVLKFLDEYADKLEKKIMRMMYNSESLIQAQFHKTATEAEIDVDSVYDTLHPFADKYSELWMFITRLTAMYLGYEKARIFHKFQSDFKFKPLNVLLSDLKSANDSNAPSYVRESISNDISDIIYADNPTELAKLRIKNKHFPFPGKTDFEIQNIILNNLTTKYMQILYANFDNIFDVIDSEYPSFYELAYTRQKEIVREQVDKILIELTPVVPRLNLSE